MDNTLASVKLMVKTGRFFAFCDGNYDDNERRLMDAFAQSVDMLADVNDEEKKRVMETLDEVCTLDQLIAETQDLLEKSHPRERQRILDVFDQFIRMVIASDHHVDRSELASYMEWRRKMGLTDR